MSLAAAVSDDFQCHCLEQWALLIKEGFISHSAKRTALMGLDLIDESLLTPCSAGICKAELQGSHKIGGRLGAQTQLKVGHELLRLASTCHCGVAVFTHNAKAPTAMKFRGPPILSNSYNLLGILNLRTHLNI